MLSSFSKFEDDFPASFSLNLPVSSDALLIHFHHFMTERADNLLGSYDYGGGITRSQKMSTVKNEMFVFGSHHFYLHVIRACVIFMVIFKQALKIMFVLSKVWME